ncbi:MAG: hypothetical protein ABI947_04240 [Chloroflexota bacterium]
MQPTGKPKEKRKGRPGLRAMQISCLVSILLVAATILVVVIWGIRSAPQPIRPTVVVRLSTPTVFPTVLSQATESDKLSGKIVFKSVIGGSALQTWMMNANGSNMHHLASLDGSVFPWNTPSWSPDQQRVTFMAFPTTSDDPDLYVMNVDGSHIVKLNQLGGYPSWSPDGLRIAFQATNGSLHPQIYTVKPDGSDKVRITQSDGAYPSWSPDSKHIVFQSADQTSNIFIKDADGSNLIQVSHIGSAGWPSWSPDGKSIVFVAQDSTGALQIYTIGIDGSRLMQITHSSRNYNPHWSPDSKHIAFHSFRDDQSQIYVIDTDGSHESQLTHVGYNSDPYWLP